MFGLLFMWPTPSRWGAAQASWLSAGTEVNEEATLRGSVGLTLFALRADESLVDHSTIAVYHCSETPRRETDSEAWKIALKVSLHLPSLPSRLGIELMFCVWLRSRCGIRRRPDCWSRCFQAMLTS